MAASRVAVAVRSDQASSSLGVGGEEPLICQIPECPPGLFSGLSAGLIGAELAGAELLPIGDEAQVLVQKLASEGHQVYGGGVACDAQHFPECGAGVVGVGLPGVDSVQDSDD